MIKSVKLFFVLIIFLLVQLSCGLPEAYTDILPDAAPVQQEAQAPTPEDLTPSQSLVSPDPVPRDADYGTLAREYLESLIEVTGPRLPGSAEEGQAADYIQTVFEEMGYSIERQPFSFTTEEGEQLNSTNLIALKQGASPQEFVIGAHYDSSDEADGADDNASGVAVLLEIAQYLSDILPPYTIRLIAFGAEENDLNGSRYYVSQLKSADIENILYMINLDSLIAGDCSYLYGDAGGPGNLREWIRSEARDAGLEVEVIDAVELDEEDGTLCECADYSPFQEAGVDFIYFESTNWNLGDEDGMTQVN